jgi:thiamine pyrophosphokinase
MASCDPITRRIIKVSPLVIVLDSAMERVMKLNIKVDVLLGDFDRDFDANYYHQSN